MRKVALVIVNWNGKEDTLVCLDSVKRLRLPSALTLETIVVDNGSTNDSVAVIGKKHPWVNLVEIKRNLGFTGGNNIGIREALGGSADFVWLLNNDTIVDQGALSLVTAFNDERVGIAGSKIYFASGHEYHKERYSQKEQGKVLWYAGGAVDWDNMYASHRGVDEVDHGQYDGVEETPFITGCSMMIRRDVLENIGLLDDRFYLYLEDLDYCLKARASGYKLLYYPSSVIWHVNAGSSGGAGNPLHEYYITRNRLLVGLRYAPVRTKSALIREALRFVINGTAIQRKAVLDAVFGRWGNQYEPKKFTN